MQSTTLPLTISLLSVPFLFSPTSLYAHLLTLTDHRDPRGVRYPLAVLLTIATLAKLAEQNELRAIADWAQLRAPTLADLFGLDRPTMPHPTTWNRVVAAAIDPQQFARVVADFLTTATPLASRGTRKPLWQCAGGSYTVITESYRSVRLTMRTYLTLVIVVGWIVGRPVFVAGATQFATPLFQAQWQTDEGRAPNFWGPLALAHDGEFEPYREAPGGQRLVQYFDKGRMDLTDPTQTTVTSGLLAMEMLTGKIQVGDHDFQSHPLPAIPIAGDPDNPGPTYATLAATPLLITSTPHQDRAMVSLFLTQDGKVSIPGRTGPLTSTATTAYTCYTYDDATRHNVPAAFDAYRKDMGVATIGWAISEPFLTTITVQGKTATVMVQVFERRVLTYTPGNPESRRVEFGNIGQHYAAWRYGQGA